jgi:phage baseplate assembly protein V
MERFLNAIKAQSGAMDRASGQPRFGIVSSVDPSRPAVRVMLQPENVLTGWLPVLSPWVGAGWGLSCPPGPGDQVFILPQEGDSEHGVVVGRAWSDSARTPSAPVGELWLVHQTGAYLKLMNDGTIRLLGNTFILGNLEVAGSITTTGAGTGNVHISGNLQATGDVSDGHGSVSALRGHYNAHVHPDPQGGSTSPTSQPD